MLPNSARKSEQAARARSGLAAAPDRLLERMCDELVHGREFGRDFRHERIATTPAFGHVQRLLLHEGCVVVECGIARVVQQAPGRGLECDDVLARRMPGHEHLGELVGLGSLPGAEQGFAEGDEFRGLARRERRRTSSLRQGALRVTGLAPQVRRLPEQRPVVGRGRGRSWRNRVRGLPGPRIRAHRLDQAQARIAGCVAQRGAQALERE